MLEQGVSAICHPIAKNSWFGTSAWVKEVHHREIVFDAMAAIEGGAYAKGHMAHTGLIEQILYSLGIAVVFIYRDLRDVVVSQAHHIMKADGEKLKHPNPEIYRALPSFEDVLIACIEGLGEFDGIIPRWEAFNGWRNAGWVHSVRFEDCIKEPKQTMLGIAHYIMGMAEDQENASAIMSNKQISTSIALEMVQRTRQRQRSITFRKGKAGGWRKEFTPRAVACFKEHDPGWLVRLGYEEDDTWER
jgi:hypothetical protein